MKEKLIISHILLIAFRALLLCASTLLYTQRERRALIYFRYLLDKSIVSIVICIRELIESN